MLLERESIRNYGIKEEGQWSRLHTEKNIVEATRTTATNSTISQSQYHIQRYNSVVREIAMEMFYSTADIVYNDRPLYFCSKLETESLPARLRLKLFQPYCSLGVLDL